MLLMYPPRRERTPGGWRMSFGKFIGVFLAAMLLLSACGGDPQKAATPAPPPQNAPAPTGPGPRGPQGQVGGGYTGPAQIGQNTMFCDGRYCYIDVWVDIGGCARG